MEWLMNRPFYETQADRRNEQELADIISSTYNCDLHKMPIKLSLDFMAMRDGKAVAFFEMRNRSNEMKGYPTYMLSLYKCMMAKLLHQTTGLPAFLAVQWTDVAGIVKIPPDNFTVEIGGTVRRNDPQDIEPMVYFNVSDFKIIK
jgi:hypothetical protein